jgi:hypothetical protein
MKTNDNGTDRDMTEAEQTAHEAWQKLAQDEAKAQDESAADKATARQAVITKLGLTADEVAALLG